MENTEVKTDLIKLAITGMNWGDGYIKGAVQAAARYIDRTPELKDKFRELRNIWIQGNEEDTQSTTSWLVLETVCYELGDAIIGDIWGEGEDNE